MTNPLSPQDWRNRTKGGIPYRVMSVEGTSEAGASDITEVYVIPVNRVVGFILESFPPAKVVNGVPVTNNRVCPGTQAQTRNISWRGLVDGLPADFFGTDADAPKGAWQPLAEVTINYSNRKDEDEQNTETLVSIQGRASADVITTASPGTKLGDSGTAESPRDDPNASENKQPGLPVVIIVPSIQWTVTIERVEKTYFKETLLPRLRNLFGTVNSDTFELLFDCPPECAMFVGFDYDEEFESYDALLLRPEKHTQERNGVLQRLDPIGWELPPPLTPAQQRINLEIDEEIRQADADQFLTLTLQFLETRKYNRAKPDNTTQLKGHNDIWDPESGSWKRAILPTHGSVNTIYAPVKYNTILSTETESEQNENG